MLSKKATDIFNQWALVGKDDGMQKHHSSAVNIMLDTLVRSRSSKFSFVDAGCGNGWVVREMRKHPLCTRSIGIDGAEEMIRKAKLIDPTGNYILSDLLAWVPEDAFDLVHSMEVFYYFKSPKKVIKHIVKNWLNEGGEMIMGIDFYKENTGNIGFSSFRTSSGPILKTKRSCKDFRSSFPTNSCPYFRFLAFLALF